MDLGLCPVFLKKKKKNLQIENGTEVFALYVKEKGHGLHALIHDLRAEVMNY